MINYILVCILYAILLSSTVQCQTTTSNTVTYSYKLSLTTEPVIPNELLPTFYHINDINVTFDNKQHKTGHINIGNIHYDIPHTNNKYITYQLQSNNNSVTLYNTIQTCLLHTNNKVMKLQLTYDAYGYCASFAILPSIYTKCDDKYNKQSMNTGSIDNSLSLNNVQYIGTIQHSHIADKVKALHILQQSNPLQQDDKNKVKDKPKQTKKVVDKETGKEIEVEVEGMYCEHVIYKTLH